MKFYLSLLFLIKIESSFIEDYSQNERIQLHNELNMQIKNAICCRNNMACCNHEPDQKGIELRAILTKCPSVHCDGSTPKEYCEQSPFSVPDHGIKHVTVFDEDEPPIKPALTNCRKKLLLTIKMSSRNLNSSRNEFVVVDHVYDPISKKDARILNPYVIKIKQLPLLQLYRLKALHVVNSQPREVIYNKKDGNYTGCDTTSRKPTCGKITYRGNVIPYSQGFCCPCDEKVNLKKQPGYNYSSAVFDQNKCELSSNTGDLNQTGELSKNKDSGPFYLLGNFVDVQNKGSKQPGRGQIFTKTLPRTKSNGRFDSVNNNYQSLQPPLEGKMFQQQRKPLHNHFVSDLYSYGDLISKFILNKQDVAFKDEIQSLEDLLKHKTTSENDDTAFFRFPNENLIARKIRAAQVDGYQIRGGQNCKDKQTPEGLNPKAYHASTHCLRFSDLWYTVYALEEPVIEHSITVEVFEKLENINGDIIWKHLTKGKAIRIGTAKKNYTDKVVSFRYKSIGNDSDEFSLDYDKFVLLAPEITKKYNSGKYPEGKNSSSEYLVLNKKEISLGGDQCDVPGVGFEAFTKQPNRCGRPKGTCLENQPHDLWMHDHLAEKIGVKGRFFLKYYGKLSKEPIRKNSKTGEQDLAMEYFGEHSSTVELEIKADFNAVLRPGSAAQITEVYIDITNPCKTVLTIKVANSGLISNYFMTKLADCSTKLSPSFGNVESSLVLIPPQHQHTFHFEIEYSLPNDRFYCSVEALNYKRELLAVRRIRLQKYDRCICTWHCLCACISSSEGLQCVPMSLDHYYAAGFSGSFPITSYLIRYTFLDEVFSMMMYMFLFVLLVLLLLGFCKGLIGLICLPNIGMWGIDMILNLPKPIEKYHESNLIDKEVLYDSQGWPVHPHTRRRMRNISKSTEFCMNIMFFFIYPSYVLISLVKRCCESRNKYQSGSNDAYKTSSKSSKSYRFRLRKQSKKTQNREETEDSKTFKNRHLNAFSDVKATDTLSSSDTSKRSDDTEFLLHIEVQ